MGIHLDKERLDDENEGCRGDARTWCHGGVGGACGEAHAELSWRTTDWTLIHFIDQCSCHDDDVAAQLLLDDNQVLFGNPKTTSHYLQVGDAKQLNGTLQAGKREMVGRWLNVGVPVTRVNVAQLLVQMYSFAYSTPNIFAGVKAIGFQYCTDGNGENIHSHIIVNDEAINAAIAKHQRVYQLGEHLRGKEGSVGTGGAYALRNHDSMLINRLKAKIAEENQELAALIPECLTASTIDMLKELRVRRRLGIRRKACVM